MGGRWIKMAVSLGLGSLVWLLPAPAGLPAPGQHLLAILALVISLWITEALPPAVTSLLLLFVLAITFPREPLTSIFSGFTSSVNFFVLGALTMSVAIVRSGLAHRLAEAIIRAARRHPGSMHAQLLMALGPMAVILPSAITRNAFLTPAYETVFDRVGLQPGAPLVKRVALTLGVLNVVVSSIFLTGGSDGVTTSQLLGGFTWWHWFAMMAVPEVTLAVAGAVVLILLHPLPTRGVRAGLAQDEPAAAAAAAHVPPLCRGEWTTAGIIGLVALLWLTDSVHHLDPSIPALLGAVLLCVPGLGVLTWKEFETTPGWSVIITVGAVLALPRLLASTGTSAWFAARMAAGLAPLGYSPVLLVLAVIAFVTVAHLLVPNIVACLSLAIPVVVDLAHVLGLNPIALGLIVTITTDAIVLYPAQTTTNLIVYRDDWVNGRDVLRFGLLMLVLVALVVTLVALPWWSLLGEPLRLAAGA